MAVDFIIETIQFKRGDAATFSLENPILLDGEPAFERDTYRFKIGDGITTWENLPYISGSSNGGSGASYLSDLLDVSSALTTNKNVLIANGSTYLGRQLTTSDISDLANNYATLASQTTQDIQISTNTANIATNAANIAVNTLKVSADASINTHIDVDLTGVLDGNVLKWSAAQSKFIPSSDTSASQLVNLTDVPSANNINGYVLVANGSTGYVGRLLLTSDISNYNSLEIDQLNLITNLTSIANATGTGISINPITNTVTLTGANGTQLRVDGTAVDAPGVSISDINTKGNQALITKEYADANYGSSIFVEDDGVSVVTSASILNFSGSGVVVTDGGAGEAIITISSGGDALTSNGLNQFANTLSSELNSIIPDSTGSGSLVFSDSPSIDNANLNTPSSINLVNGVNLPINTGTTGNLSVTRLNSGTGASSVTFWRGDGVWAIPPSGGGGVASYNNTYTEIPTGDVDGFNQLFIVSQNEYKAGSLVVYLDGQAFINTLGITETNPSLGTFEFDDPPNAGQVVYVTYQIGVPLAGGVVQSDTTGVTGAEEVKNIMSLTQAQYDTIITPDPQTFYIITDAIDPSVPISTNVGTVIDLSRTGGNYMYMNAASGITTYSYINETLGGWAQVLINSSSEPVVTGATKINGAAFQASTNQYMVVFDNGNRVEYYFLDI